MTSYEERLTALDRALVGASSGDFHDDVVERARAFEAYLTGESAEAAAAPEPRPFQVGDKVLVAEGAGFYLRGRLVRSCINAPCEAFVTAPHVSDDYTTTVAATPSVGRPVGGYSVHPSFLTLKEAAK